MKLIDKDALVAEINKRIMDAPIDCYGHQRVWAYNDVKNILDTLEVKEVDLEKELDTWRHNHFHGRRDKEASGEYLERVSQLDLAKHFFELGLKQYRKEIEYEYF